ncbi:hypothetical protein FACS189490_09790 [Clostridia bacterium]|nr:hypothetical protein FACS189490_09790 [Clostridia bacterium]
MAKIPNRTCAEVYPLNAFGDYRYSVIFAQHNGKWLFCRHKERETWEMAGGHIERGETPLEGAKRELFEETGAVEFDIYPAFDYKWSDAAGQVFFAEVKTLGELPDYSEMAEVRAFDAPPDSCTYPYILPVLYAKTRKWLGLDCGGKDELWDVLDENRNSTGRTHRRGDALPDGDFHLVVCAWILNEKGEFLIARRSLRKIGSPGMWEIPSGSAVSGEDSLTTVLREAREETGITLLPENGELFSSYRRGNSFYDNFLFRQEFDLADVVLQEGETIDAKTACFNDIAGMMFRGEFIGREMFSEFDALGEILRKDGLK